MNRALFTGALILLAAPLLGGTAAHSQTAAAVSGMPDAKVIPPDNAPAASAAATSQSDGAGIRKQLAANLQKSGFTDVKIVPEAYIVHATDKTGNPVMMFISPDSLTVFTALDAKGEDARTATGAKHGAESN